MVRCAVGAGREDEHEREIQRGALRRDVFHPSFLTLTCLVSWSAFASAEAGGFASEVQGRMQARSLPTLCSVLAAVGNDDQSIAETV